MKSTDRGDGADIWWSIIPPLWISHECNSYIIPLTSITYYLSLNTMPCSVTLFRWSFPCTAVSTWLVSQCR